MPPILTLGSAIEPGEGDKILVVMLGISNVKGHVIKDT